MVALASIEASLLAQVPEIDIPAPMVTAFVVITGGLVQVPPTGPQLNCPKVTGGVALISG